MMWIIVSYDFPSDDPAQYRRFRKCLLKCGFTFIQKSLCWRWVHSMEKAGSIQSAVRNALQSSGNILLWQLSDRSFASAFFWEDRRSVAMPDPPDPWLVL